MMHDDILRIYICARTQHAHDKKNKTKSIHICVYTSPRYKTYIENVKNGYCYRKVWKADSLLVNTSRYKHR